MPVRSSFSHIKHSILLVLTACLAASAYAAGVLDREFGNGGHVAPELGRGADAVDIAVNGSRIIVAGNYLSGSSKGSIFLYGLEGTGAAAAGFGDQGLVRFGISGVEVKVFDLEPLSDGTLILAGTAVYADGTSDLLAIRFLPDGTADRGFAENGVLVVDLSSHEALNSIAVLEDGSLVAAGGASGPGIAAVAIKIGSDGRLDPGFGNGGAAVREFENAGFFDIDFPSDIEPLPDGGLRLGGDWEFTLDGVEKIGSYLIDLGRDGSPVGFDATAFVDKSGYNCRASFDGEVLPDGRYVHVSRQGGINPFHDGSSLVSLPGGKLAAAGGCIGGSLKMYSGGGQRLIGIERDLAIERAAAFGNGSLAVLTESNSVVLLKGVTSAGTRQQNFNERNRADLAVFRPEDKTLYVNDGLGRSSTFVFGSESSKIIPERAVFLSSNEGVKGGTIGYWNIHGKSGSFGIRDSDGAMYLSHAAGTGGDIPFAGDFDADGAIDTGVFRSSEGNWYRKIHFASQWFGEPVKWGVPGDRPVPADYDGDGMTDLAVFRPSNGTWWVRRSSDGGTFAAQFGISSDIPLTGDFDADGRADLTVYRPHEGNWYQYLTAEGFRVVKFGIATDIPVPADYDGDGRFDIAVYREGIWFLLKSTEGFAAIQWGSPGDRPVTARYDS
ncbi:MAG: VCBS repeat-containing protein [Acidobacteriota bacterium]|nr:MAG: VCBS repeat-containing protein [Acidobacteriota bacterium]